MYSVRIHKRNSFRKPSKNRKHKNDFILLCSFYDSDNYGAWQRHLRHMGFNTQPLAERDVVDYEKENIDNSWRLHSYSYRSWTDLIRDEYRVTGDRQWIEKLCEVSREKINPDDIIQFVENEAKVPAPVKPVQLNMFAHNE